MRYNENSKRNQYDSYGDGGDNLKSKHQQPNYKHYEHLRNIGEPTIFNSKQHGRLDISNSKNAGWWTRCI